MKPTLMLLFLAPAVSAVQAAFASRLPATVASHFDAAGIPIGWSGRGSFLATFLGLLLVLSLILWGLTAALHRVPPSLLSLPRKEYWLEPQRREATYAALKRLLFWFAVATQAFLLALFQLSIQANLRQPVRLPQEAFWTCFGTYLALVAIWMVLFFLRFTRMPKSPIGVADGGRSL